jgi:hypothetical protein
MGKFRKEWSRGTIMNSEIGHSIKHRQKPNDVIYTPRDLAKTLVDKVSPKIKLGDIVLDPFKGGGAFYDHFFFQPPEKGGRNDWCEIEQGRDFFEWDEQVDWCISNPPWSLVDDVLKHTCEVSRKGFAYLLNNHGCTPRRLEICENAGFGLTKMHLCKVFEWYGIAAFCVFEKDKESIIEYDRTVWRPDG